jgi:tetratricopeptide (TPR) repeat protein
MRLKQYITIGICTALLIIVYLFANTIKPLKDITKEPSKTTADEGSFHFEDYLTQLNSEINKDTLRIIQTLLPSISDEKILDSVGILYAAVNHPEVAAYYQNKLAIERNTALYWGLAGDKSYLAGILTGKNEELRTHLFNQAIEAFKKASELSPKNDSFKVKLATCYMDGTPDVMSGVSILREIVARDSNNVEAQFTLGRYGIVSGQFEKSIIRLEKVISLQPSNADAYLLIAEAYEKSGAIDKAILALEKGKSLVQDVNFKKEIADYITQLKQKNK